MKEWNQIFLLPGEIVVAQEPALLMTVLGSCVAVCLYNTKFGFGGMNHYQLPRPPGDEKPSSRYGNYSMENLIKLMQAKDLDLKNLQATILGGGIVFDHLGLGKKIASENIEIAKTVLVKYDINIHSITAGEDYGLKVSFRSWDGGVTFKKIRRLETVVPQDKGSSDIMERPVRVVIFGQEKESCHFVEQAIINQPSLHLKGIACDSFEARRIYLECDPDVVLFLIDKNEIKMMRFLKKLLFYKHKPIIVIGEFAQSNVNVSEVLLEMKINHFMPRQTVTESSLKIKIKEVLKNFNKSKEAK